ncbi:peptidoglycan-associated lipoprotein Pal [Candidatus Persebacteraceae bacterium Df01]|jgi:peptidoglycan-associated lipoprotein|uniref:Peptidoglycan-associated lipoprotein n=1 Tax=Candidatus Doriopsillibacter californiensis TaxID=2970740 RepID=A0ABT7QK45_9GAMM|nr:peptidoglycan-associated lipoprotein Pal [Candidatus Persebacteraceae bacterium Df01]
MKGRVLASTILMAFLAISGCAQKANYSGDIKDEQAEVDVVDITSTSGVSDDKTPGFTSQPDAIDDERKGDGLLKERLIFFDYDKSAIKEHYLHIISAHADFLVRNPSMGIILEGNTDNRGSNEYNLALGQRRADATRDIMLSSGVSPSQIETLSFGEEEPRAQGENEEAWAKNRRVSIRYNDE